MVRACAIAFMTMANKKGRPKRSVIDELRVRLWYQSIKGRSGWSDYKLDMEFGQAEGACTADGALRTRVFDVIRRKGTLPSRANHHRRSFDLIARVDSHPNFHGSRALFDSLFWDLLHLPPRDLDTTTKFVEMCLDRLELTRLTGNDAITWLWFSEVKTYDPKQPGLKKGGTGAFEATIQQATQALPVDLDLIALYGALYRESCISFNLESAEVAGILFKISLASFFETQWAGEMGAVLSDIAINRVIHGIENYLPSSSDSSITQELIITPKGFIVSKNNSLLNQFLEDRETIKTAMMAWIFSSASAEVIDSLSIPDTDKQLIYRIRGLRKIKAGESCS